VFRLASYNVCNLFEETSEHKKKPREIRATAEVLTMLQANLVCIQEVASTAALNLVNDRLKNPYEVCRVVPGNYYRGLHLGVLSDDRTRTTSFADFKLVDAEGRPLFDYANPEHADTDRLSELKVQRDLLRIDVGVNDTNNVDDIGKLNIFCVHLKSHSPSPWRNLDNDTIRTAECDALIRLIGEFSDNRPNQPVVIAGDLNETENRPIVQKLVSELNLFDAIEFDWVRTHNKPSFSYQNYPSRARLDYLLLNPSARALYIKNSAKIHGTPSGRVASDHYPVSIDLELT